MNQKLNKTVFFKDLGLIDYKEGWDFQEKTFAGIIAKKIENRTAEEQGLTENHLFFCEHPHVYTLGKSGKASHLLLDDAGLEAKEASFYPVNRGGDITYHGPGQLVGYPILDLENFFTDIHKYMRLLEEAIILTLADYSISAGRIAGLTGVWLDFDTLQNPRKICAMGVKSSRWVTMHGFALNVNPDLDYFGNIVPCGIDDKAVTSIKKELGDAVDIKIVAEKLKNHLVNLFEMDLVEVD
jgi:lipoyl(octanoyl) transferase